MRRFGGGFWAGSACAADAAYAGSMSLKLIIGPPNSGRTGGRLDGFRAAASRDPVLVVPTVDDVERFEEELTGEGDRRDRCDRRHLRGALQARGPGDGRPGRARRSAGRQRRRLAREAVSRAELGLLAASSRRPGFPAALEELISELQAALIDPASLRERAAEAGPYELEIAALYGAYVEVRDELGRHDDHSLAAAATAALRAAPGRLGGAGRSSSTGSTTSPSSSSSWSGSSRGAPT